MKKIWTIAWRDFKVYFTSPLGYVVLALIIFIMGFSFRSALMYFSQEAMKFQQFNMGKQLSITQGIIQPFFGNVNVFGLFLLPLISMRLFAEERKNHTLELLFTSPIRPTQIILGKYLSALMFIIAMLAFTLVYPLILTFTGNPDWGPIMTNYLGTFFMFACMMAAGTFFSSMTDSQMVAFILTEVTILFFWLIRWGASSAGGDISEFLTYLSLIDHYVKDFSKGVISSSDVIYYCSFIGVFLFLTQRVLDSYRWR